MKGVDDSIVLFIAAIALLGGIGVAWWSRRRRERQPVADSQLPPASLPDSGATASGSGAAIAPATDLRSASLQYTDLLWRRVFDANAPRGALPEEHRKVLEAVRATLASDSLGERHFPRRPMLMPQLLHAVNDPQAGPARLAAIVAQDPVLTGDVLRLANSTFYRITPHPVESIQRAIVVCGSDGLQSLVATALMQPVFRGSHAAFARFPVVLWERTAQAAVAAELYAIVTRRGDRLLAQLASLLGALGPLVIYRTVIEAYARAMPLEPHPALFLDLIETTGAATSLRIARSWELPARVLDALAVAAGAAPAPAAEQLAEAVAWGSLLGTLSALETERALAEADAERIAAEAGLAPGLFTQLWKRIKAGG